MKLTPETRTKLAERARTVTFTVLGVAVIVATLILLVYALLSLGLLHRVPDH